MEKQKILFESGNEVAAFAAKQINYHIMGYYPITPSTQIAEFLDQMKADGEHDIVMIPAEGEHSAAGICYGASTGGGRVFNATSANGLLYALEQLPVQSGTRFPMVMNVACRTVSGPLCIKGDHSDIMFTLNAGWIILFANTPQAVYDMNICGLKIAEAVKLPVIVAFDGFFTSHQKRRCMVFEQDETVQKFVGEYHAECSALDLEHPVSIGSYMNEPDVLNNKFQLHQAMEEAAKVIPEVFAEYAEISGRQYGMAEGYCTEDADVLLCLLGSAYHTAKVAVDKLRGQGKKVGVFTTNVLRPYPAEELFQYCKNAKTIMVGDRQDSYGAMGGNLSIELKAMLQEHGKGADCRVLSRVYGLGGRDFYESEAEEMLLSCYRADTPKFDYLGKYSGDINMQTQQYFAPISEKEASPGLTQCVFEGTDRQRAAKVQGGRINETTAMPKRLAPGHGACPGCGCVKLHELEAVVYGAMVKKLKDFKTLTGRKKAAKISPKLTAKRLELAQVESEIEKLLDTLTGASPVLLSYANSKIEELDAKRQTISNEIAKLSADAVPAEKIESISGYLDDWENVSFEDKRQVVDALITVIRATNEKVEIEWKI